MAERNDLLLFGFALEYDYKEKERAKEIYEKYIFTHGFFATYSTLIGQENAVEEVTKSLKSEPLLYTVTKFDKYLTILMELYRYYGKDGFLKAIGRGRLKFSNYESIVVLRKRLDK